MTERSTPCAQSRAATPVTSERIDAVLFDMDGVVTDTAEAHAAAWKRLFDEYLQARARARDEEFRPFDADADYREYVDGKPRYEGVKSFLASRGIDLPYGDEQDDPGIESVCGLGNRKNRYFREWLMRHDVETFPDTIALLETLRRKRIRTAVFSASRNAEAVLESAGVRGLFDAKVDGDDRAALGLPGKPDPAILLEAASRLGVRPERAAIVEDSTAGVAAGSAGGFALVVGVDRAGHAEALLAHGADVIVTDTRELLPDRPV